MRETEKFQIKYSNHNNILKTISINILALNYECCPLISSATHYLLCDRCILGDPGPVSEGRKKAKWTRKKFRRTKSRTRRRALLGVLLDFSSLEFFSRPFRLFPALTNCPWVVSSITVHTNFCEPQNDVCFLAFSNFLCVSIWMKF